MSEKLTPYNIESETSRDKADNIGEIQEDNNEAFDTAVAVVGSAFHEDWRKTRLNSDGSYEPRVKTTSDETWIEEHGTDQIDIANSSYENLPEDWKGENKAAAEVVVDLIDQYQGEIDLSDPVIRNEIGANVHDAWLSRNEWAKDGELDVPFEDLPKDEQDKDLDQVKVALELLSQG